MIPDPNEQPLLSVDEFLEAVPGWPRGRSATHEAIRRGELPSIRLGNSVFLITSQLRQLLGLNATEGAASSWWDTATPSDSDPRGGPDATRS